MDKKIDLIQRQMEAIGQNESRKTPSASDTIVHSVSLTQCEMQSIASAMAGYFNFMYVSKSKPNEVSVSRIHSALIKFKEVLDNDKGIELAK